MKLSFCNRLYRLIVLSELIKQCFQMLHPVNFLYLDFGLKSCGNNCGNFFLTVPRIYFYIHYITYMHHNHCIRILSSVGLLCGGNYVWVLWSLYSSRQDRSRCHTFMSLVVIITKGFFNCDVILIHYTFQMWEWKYVSRGFFRAK